MTAEQHEVDLITPGGSVRPGRFLVRRGAGGAESQVELTLVLPDRQVVAEAPDGFEALVAIRQQIEPDGWRIVCWGACLHVYPSEQSRGTDQGLTAYRLTPGRFARATDRVHLLASGPGLVVATVAEQEEFSRAWFDSLMDLPG